MDWISLFGLGFGLIVQGKGGVLPRVIDATWQRIRNAIFSAREKHSGRPSLIEKGATITKQVIDELSFDRDAIRHAIDESGI